MRSSSRMPGSRCETRRSSSRSAPARSRVASSTARPARAMALASATPQAPAPTTAIWSKEYISRSSEWKRTSRLLKKFVGELIFAMFPSQAEASRRDDLRYRLRIRYLFASSWLLQTDSSRCGQYLWDANEIVGGRGEDEEPFDQRPSAV